MTTNEYGQEPKSYAAKPRSLRDIFPVGFSREARRARKEADDVFWSFSGRASRSEFWWTFCVLTGLNLFIGVFEGITSSDSNYPLVVYFASLIAMLPVAVRRFHDTGKSGWWAILYPGQMIASVPVHMFSSKMTAEGYGILAILILVCTIAGLITLSLKGKPEKTRFDKDD